MSLSCERQKMLAELKMPGGLCTQVVHCTQRTPLKPQCENAPTEFVSLPQVILAKSFWCNYSLSASVWWLIFQTASGELSFQSQTPTWDPITTHLQCLGRSRITEVHLKDEGARHVIAESKSHSSTTNLGRKGLMHTLNSAAIPSKGSRSECPGTLELHLRECLCPVLYPPPPTNRAGKKEKSAPG